MKIKKIISCLGNDYSAVMVCEHCGHECIDEHGYNDSFYHNKIIPNMICLNCHKNRAGDIVTENKKKNNTKAM